MTTAEEAVQEFIKRWTPKTKKVSTFPEYLKFLLSEYFIARQEMEAVEKQRGELMKMMNSLMLSIAAHPDYVNGDEDDEWHTLLSLSETAIKNAER